MNILSVTPDQVTNAATAWITAGVAIIIGLTGAAALVLPKIAAIREQIKTLFENQKGHDADIKQTAQNLQQVSLLTAPPTMPSPEPPADPNPMKPLIILLALFPLLTGCQTLQTGLTKVEAFIAKPTTQSAVIGIIRDAAPLVQQYAETGRVSNAQGINLGLQAVANLAPTVTSNEALQRLIVNTVVVYSGDPKAANLGRDLAQIVIRSLPPAATSQEITNAIVGLGIGASNGAEQASNISTP